MVLAGMVYTGYRVLAGIVYTGYRVLTGMVLNKEGTMALEYLTILRRVHTHKTQWYKQT